MYDRTILVKDVRHGVRQTDRIYGVDTFRIRVRLGCGGHFDEAWDPDGMLPVTCVWCLAGTQRYVSLQSDVGVGGL